MRKKGIALLLTGAVALAVAGCADNPEKSVVKEKNMDKMLEQAEGDRDASSYEQVKDEVQKKYETYQTKIEDKKLKVNVNVDAKVEIPETEKLSVYRVSAKKIKQGFLDRAREVLAPGVSLYDGSKNNARTKAVVAKEIRENQRFLEDAKKSGDKGISQEYSEEIGELKREYKEAPAKVNVTDYPLDNKIQSIEKLYDGKPNDTFYSWLHDLHGSGQVFYGVSDGKDENYYSMYLQNSENYGNCLRYNYNKHAYASPIYHADVGSDIPQLCPLEEGKEPDFAKAGIEGWEAGASKCVDNESLTISEQEAQGQVIDLLDKLGLQDYQCYQKGKYAQILGEDGREIKYRNVYRFLCLRTLDGVFVNNQAGFKLTDGFQGNQHVKKMWESEAVAVSVCDSGIVDFYYLSPLSVNKTVVEKSKIKSFSEIKDTFEQMVVIENANNDSEAEEREPVSIKVTDVNLVYTRISEKDSFDTGLVVPVWNFEGTIVDEAISGKYGYEYEKKGNILSINAIDGSVINQELGY
ncbi:MAG: hypothetical protein HFH62_05020 [Lachnospiraceae bacterium]|nr:hypothetical protein [Lachnospiraceae bacterium]